MNPASTVEFRENRARFTHAELQPYVGKWVAFSADGKRIVDSGEDFVGLYDRIHDANANVAFERIEIDSDEICLGGAEFL
jgi:hypothetical protein